MRADVGDGAQIASQLLFEAPVPIRGMQEPVLQKAPLSNARLADGSLRYQSARFLAQRVVAQIVSNAADAFRFAREFHQHFGLAGIHG